jgi:hypothetical protein
MTARNHWCGTKLKTTYVQRRSVNTTHFSTGSTEVNVEPIASQQRKYRKRMGLKFIRALSGHFFKMISLLYDRDHVLGTRCCFAWGWSRISWSQPLIAKSFGHPGDYRQTQRDSRCLATLSAVSKPLFALASGMH